ncbi:E3 ubiquitin-protein ligase NRDP1-like [Teleopsis dalmanni]|uniref:E3 ubiquitin-protein ligase NRDP1-like n=1 Tax=Teleopsis dalmanni TaxID=139649 RepID=UPI0018CF8DE6|nr:E3 ubiquitin-protein ligase NRDP1-like [Teleopsis dalmanni]
MGFDCDLVVGTYNSSIICHICLDVIEDPLECRPCLHTFCAACADAWFSNNNVCPVDRSIVTTRKPSVGIISKLLLRTQTKCEFHNYGCKEEMFLIEFKDHIENCSFQPEKEYICSKGCGCEVKRKDEQTHDCVMHLSKLIIKHQNKLRTESDGIEYCEQGLEYLSTKWHSMCDLIYINCHIDLRPKETCSKYSRVTRTKLINWGASLPLATVESWKKICTRPEGILIEKLKDALIACQCPLQFMERFLRNATECYWPFGIVGKYQRCTRL